MVRALVTTTIITMAMTPALITTEITTPVRDITMAARIVGQAQTPTVPMDRTPIICLTQPSTVRRGRTVGRGQIQIQMVTMAQTPTAGRIQPPMVTPTACPAQIIITGGSSGSIK